MTTVESDVLIVGGGILGASLGYFLGKLGIKTTVIERNFIASGATSMSAGTLFYPGPNALTRDHDEYCVSSMHIIQDLSKQKGYDVGLKQPGSIAVARTFSEYAFLYLAAWYNRKYALHNNEFLSRTELKAVEPALSDRTSLWGGVHYPDSGQVNPEKLTHAFCREALLTGAVSIFEDCKIVRVGTRRGDTEGRNKFVVDAEVSSLTRKVTFETDYMVLCNGAWVNSLTDPIFGRKVDVVPVKGQIWVTDKVTSDATTSAYSEVPATKVLFGTPSYLYWGWHNKKLKARGLPPNVTHDWAGTSMTQHYYGKAISNKEYAFGGLRQPLPLIKASDSYISESSERGASWVNCSINGEHLDSVLDMSIDEDELCANHANIRDIYGRVGNITQEWTGLMPFSRTGSLFLGPLREHSTTTASAPPSDATITTLEPQRQQQQQQQQVLGCDRVWIANGFGGSGIMLGPGAMMVLAQRLHKVIKDEA